MSCDIHLFSLSECTGLVGDLGFEQLETILVGGATEGQKVKGPRDEQLSKTFAEMSDQKLPFELVRALRGVH